LEYPLKKVLDVKIKPRLPQMWVDNPIELFQDVNIIPSSNQSFSNRINTLTRLVIVIAIVMSVMKYQYTNEFLIFGFFVIIILAYTQRDGPVMMSSTQLYQQTPQQIHGPSKNNYVPVMPPPANAAPEWGGFHSGLNVTQVQDIRSFDSFGYLDSVPAMREDFRAQRGAPQNASRNVPQQSRQPVTFINTPSLPIKENFVYPSSIQQTGQPSQSNQSGQTPNYRFQFGARPEPRPDHSSLLLIPGNAPLGGFGQNYATSEQSSSQQQHFANQHNQAAGGQGWMPYQYQDLTPSAINQAYMTRQEPFPSNLFLTKSNAEHLDGGYDFTPMVDPTGRTVHRHFREQPSTEEVMADVLDREVADSLIFRDAMATEIRGQMLEKEQDLRHIMPRYHGY
jgi:hypothetical protein